MLAGDFARQNLAEGVNLYVHQTTQFKTTTVYVYVRQPLAPETVTYGALLPMVLTRGSKEFPTTALLARRFDDLYGANFGYDVGRRGEVQLLTFRLEVAGDPYAPGESLFRNGLQTLAGMILQPAVTDSGLVPEHVEQEKSNLQQRIEGLINDKRAYALYRCTQEMCAGEPYALHRLGRVADLCAMTPQTLLAYHQQLLATAPIDIFVVGEMDPTEAAAEVRGAFALSGGPRRVPGTTVRRAPAQAEPRYVTEAMDVSQGVLVVGFRTGLTVLDGLYAPMLMANGVLGGFSHSKLFQSVREEHSLAYFAYSAVETVKGIGIMYAGIEFEHYQKALDISLAQLRDLQQGNIDEEEFETTRQALINDTLSALDSPGEMVDLALDRIFSGKELSVRDRIAALRAVTAEQTTEAARHFAVDTVYFLTRKGGE